MWATRWEGQEKRWGPEWDRLSLEKRCQSTRWEILGRRLGPEWERLSLEQQWWVRHSESL